MTQEEFEAKYVNKIHCADCLDLMKDWPDGCVDLVIIDPPYNLGKNYGPESNDNLPSRDYWEWFSALAFQLARVLKAGYLYMSHSDKGIYEAKPLLDKTSLRYQQTLVWWGKNGYSMQLHRKTWSYRHELILFYEKPEALPLLAGEPGYWYTSVIEASRPQSNFTDGRCHPTQKPLLLYWTLLRRTPGDIVLDCCCGSGTTCVAAKKLGRRFIGIDISSEYCRIARERLKAVDTGVPVKEARIGQQPLFA